MNVYYRIESQPKADPLGLRVKWTIEERHGAYALFDSRGTQTTPTFPVLAGAVFGAVKFLDQIEHDCRVDRVPDIELPDDKSILQVPTVLRDELLQRIHDD